MPPLRVRNYKLATNMALPQQTDLVYDTEYNRHLFVFECNNSVLYAQLVARLLIQIEVL